MINYQNKNSPLILKKEKNMLFLAQIINFVFQVYLWIVLASCVISFVAPHSNNQIILFIRKITQPAFNAVRKILPFVVIGGLDLSPIIVIIALQFLQKIIITFLVSLI